MQSVERSPPPQPPVASGSHQSDKNKTGNAEEGGRVQPGTDIKVSFACEFDKISLDNPRLSRNVLSLIEG